MAAPPLFKRVFIANRGEVAVRVARTCEALGITPVMGTSEADGVADYVRGREHVFLGPARAAQSYLDPERVLQAAKQSGCTALHPGWGFLSENPRFAALCEAHGITFIGPPAHVMHLMGKKTPAKCAMAAAGLDLIPGSDGVLRDLAELESLAEHIGYPLLIKAESGGGGRGMRIARSSAELADAYHGATQEAASAFGDPRVYVERLIEHGRHIEIQLLADKYGNVVHLGERDCTVQRKHQKLIEESPSPVLAAEERARVLELARRATASIGYVGAGTMEFLLDDTNTLRFMEMNTRLQVEHTVSEMRTGLDLVREQLLVAAGHPLALRQEDVTLSGAAIECRINAEDPSDDFRPSPGTITKWEVPSLGPELRIDTHVSAGYVVPPHYDSLICKVISHGANRAQAITRMVEGLSAMRCKGVPTTIPMHLAVLQSPEFQSGNYDTSAIPGWPSRA
ncbi:MAG: biotin carboxylase N-terminal domain-containing protein [Polyangiaceae bacterium]